MDWNKFLGPDKTFTRGTERAIRHLRKWNKGESDATRKAIIRDAIAALQDGRGRDSGKFVSVDLPTASVSVNYTGCAISIQRKEA